MKRNLLIFVLILLSSNLYAVQKAYFIENKGQWDREVRFLARLNGMNAWITDCGIVYDFYTKGDGKNNYELPITNYELLRDSGFGVLDFGKEDNGSRFPMHNSRKGHVVKMTFADGNKPSKLSESLELSESYHRKFIGINKSETYYNYFIGNDTSKWASYVPLYEEVLIKNVYEGIDVRYYFDNGMLRYDLNISPFANLNKFKMKFDGQDSLTINENGELVIGTSIGEVVNKNLIAWQKTKANKINCKFMTDENGFVGFGTNDYNKEMVLVIDPLIFSTFLGGNGSDWASHIALDKNNNIYISGQTRSTNFPTTIGAYDNSFNGDLQDITISKFNEDCSELIFSTFLGSDSTEYCQDITLDSSNNVLIIGYVANGNFPLTLNALDDSFNGGRYDGIICKLKRDGSDLLYSSFIGGNHYDYCNSINVDKNDNIFIIGETYSNNFPTTVGAFDESFNDPVDIFVCKMNIDVPILIYSTYIGGSLEDRIDNSFVDTQGNIVICGSTSSANFPSTSNIYDNSHNGGLDCYITKLNDNGSALIFSTFFGGSNNDILSSLTMDSNDNIYIAGLTYSDDFPISPNTYDSTFNDKANIFISKINNTGTQLLNSTFFGSSNADLGIHTYIGGIALDKFNNIIINGSSPVFVSTTPGAYCEEHDYKWDDIFLSKFDNNLSELLYSTYIGGSEDDQIYWHENLFIDNSGNALITGRTESPDFPVTLNSYDNTYNYGWDIFILKLDFTPHHRISIQRTYNDSYCAGDLLTIPFRATASYIEGNKFIAQLSDKNGDFTNPILLDSIIKSTSGNLILDTLWNVMIPVQIDYGSNYKIRIVSTDPLVIGYETNPGISINKKPEPILEGSNRVCAGNSYVYSVKPLEGHNYYWIVNGGEIVDSLYNSVIGVKWISQKSGTISLVDVINSTNCSNTVTMSVDVMPLPIPIISGTTNVISTCSVKYKSLIENNEYSCRWQASNGEIIGSNKFDSVLIKWDKPGKGTIKLVQENKLTGCIDSVNIEVMIEKYIEPELFGDTVVCEGDSKVYMTNLDNSFNKKWFVVGGVIIGSSTDSVINIIWTNPGIGILTIIQEDSLRGYCDTNNKEIIIKNLPEQPQITQQGKTLISSSESGNQWYKNGEIIENADGKEYTPDTTAYYTVIVTGENGCKSLFSKPYFFDITDVENHIGHTNNLRIFPNPANDILNIEYSINANSNVSLEIYDILGNKIKSADYGFVEAGKHNVILSLSKDEDNATKNLQSGMYYLVLRAGDVFMSAKFGVVL